MFQHSREALANTVEGYIAARCNVLVRRLWNYSLSYIHMQVQRVSRYPA